MGGDRVDLRSCGHRADQYQDSQPFVVFGYPIFLGFTNAMSALVGGMIVYRLAPLLLLVVGMSALALPRLCLICGDITTDDLFHDLGGAAVDGLHPGVDEGAGHRILRHVAVSAVQL
jgi:hypothetical protein